MGDAPHHVDPERQGSQEVHLRGGAPIESVLGEGDQLEVHVGRDPAPHVEERLDPDQPVVAHVHVRADGEDAPRHRPVAVGEGAAGHFGCDAMRGLRVAVCDHDLRPRFGEAPANRRADCAAAPSHENALSLEAFHDFLLSITRFALPMDRSMVLIGTIRTSAVTPI